MEGLDMEKRSSLLGFFVSDEKKVFIKLPPVISQPFDLLVTCATDNFKVQMLLTSSLLCRELS
jgi:hypothetical protein